MLPIAPLMIEHRLIERMVELMKAKQSRNEANPMSGAFVRAVVDFLRSYADRVHHGKKKTSYSRNSCAPGCQQSTGGPSMNSRKTTGGRVRRPGRWLRPRSAG